MIVRLRSEKGYELQWWAFTDKQKYSKSCSIGKERLHISNRDKPNIKESHKEQKHDGRLNKSTYDETTTTTKIIKIDTIKMKEIHIVKILHCLGLLIPYCQTSL